MKPWGCLSLFFLLLFQACSNGANSGDAGVSATPTPSPTEISSSAQVVKLSTSPVTLAGNGSVDAVVTLSVTTGFHINANPASSRYAIATELLPDKLDGVTPGKPIYPSGVTMKFQFQKEPLTVYEGEVTIKLPLAASSSFTAGTHSLPIKVRVQACDTEKCYAPDYIQGTISVTAN